MNYIKYPKTLHLPWSPNLQNDDRVITSLDSFIDKDIIITLKMDGENTTLYNDHCHARSLDSVNHISRDWIKQFHGTIKHEIPIGYRICGENLYAKHSIKYENLKSYFYGFSIWNENNICLSWKDTLEWFSLLNIEHPDIIFEGKFDEQEIIIGDFFKPYSKTDEGYVIRIKDKFHYDDFQKNVVKWVRKNHVQTTEHWLKQQLEPNNLRSVK